MIFFEFLKTPFIENCLRRFFETFRSIIQKLLECSAQSFCENIFKFRDFWSFFQNYQKKFRRLKKRSEKIHNYSNKFEKWGFGCTISPSSSPHIDAWLRNWLQSSKSLNLDPTQSILEKRKNFEGGPLCPEQFFFFRRVTGKIWIFE